MGIISRLPLARKIRALTMLTTAVTLGMAGIVLIAFESYSFYHTRIDTLKAVAGIVGSNSSAAIVFHDGDSAREILSSFSAKVSITAASLYAADGSVIAVYVRDHANQFHAPPMASGRLRIFARPHSDVSLHRVQRRNRRYPLRGIGHCRTLRAARPIRRASYA